MTRDGFGSRPMAREMVGSGDSRKVHPYDAILILGGGVREQGDLPPWAQARFDLALERQTGEPLVCLSAGTTHSAPPLDADGFPFLEAFAGARYLLSCGVPPKQIRIEAASYDTVGNAYFSKLLHVDPEGWRRMLVITSEFHMNRTRECFEWVFSLPPADHPYDLEFAFSDNRDMPPEALERRREAERQGLEHLRQNSQRLQTAAEFHRWFFTEHGAYAAQRTALARRTRDPLLLGSY